MDHERTPQPTSAPQAPAVQSQTAEVTIERIQVVAPSARDSSGDPSTAQAHSAYTEQPLLGAASQDPTPPRSHENTHTDFERVPPPARSRDGHARAHSQRHGLASVIGLPLPRQNSGIDWIVPVDEKDHSRRTVGERLKPTINNAMVERDKYARRASWSGYAINIAIGLQVILGALTTGISAAVSNARRAQVSTTVLGGLATLIASFLARARGSGEPELSTMRVKDLEQFLRECMAFQIDHAHEYATPENKLDFQVEYLRRKFEELLGNTAQDKNPRPVGVMMRHERIV